tara:strand:- start:303 stop:437 length:135 start_codon:yes stop_codon:yes gene_type:complete
MFTGGLLDCNGFLGFGGELTPIRNLLTPLFDSDGLMGIGGKLIF